MAKKKKVDVNIIKYYSPVLGEIGTAGLGAVLEQSLPILEGGFIPEGLGRADGLVLEVELAVNVDVARFSDVVVIVDGVVESGVTVSCASSILITLGTLYIHHYKLLHVFLIHTSYKTLN